MVEDSITKATVNTERDDHKELNLKANISASASIFSTYELIECITLALRDGNDILAIATANKACYDVSITSIQINKHLISSKFLSNRILIKGRCIFVGANKQQLSKHAKEQLLCIHSHRGIFIVLRRGDRDLVSVPRLKKVFVVTTEVLTGVPERDRARLALGWGVVCRDRGDDEGLLSRLADLVWKIAEGLPRQWEWEGQDSAARG